MNSKSKTTKVTAKKETESKQVNKNTPTTKTTSTTKTETKTTSNIKDQKKNEQLKVGDKVTVEVVELNEYHLEIKYKDYRGIIHISNFEAPTENGIDLFESIKPKHKLEVYIVQLNDTKKWIECSQQKDQIKLSVDSLKSSQIVKTFVYGQTSSNELAVFMKPDQIGYLDILSNFSSVAEFEKFKNSRVFLKCQVKQVSKDKRVELSLFNSKASKIKQGQVVIGLVQEIQTCSMKVRLSSNLLATVKLVDVDNQNLHSEPFSIYQQGDLLNFFVKSITNSGVFLSLDSEVLGADASSQNPKFENVTSIKRKSSPIGQGVHTWGYIVELNSQMARVQLTTEDSAVLLASETNAYYWSTLTLGKLIRVVLGSVKEEGTPQQSVSAKFHPGTQLTETTIKLGDILPLEVKSIKDYGIFVQSGKIHALCHISQVADQLMTPELLKENFSEGDLVIGKCCKIEDYKISELKQSKAQKFNKHQKFSLNFTLKPSELEGIDIDSKIRVDWDIQDTPEPVPSRTSAFKTPFDRYLSEIQKQLEMGEDAMSVDTETNNNDIVAFNWNGTSESVTQDTGSKKRKEMDKYDDEIESDLEESEQGVEKKKLKLEKSKTREKNEKEIKEKEDLLSEQNSAPESPQDFERLLLGSPNSSYIWVQYMSFYLGLSEINKAREIGERALKKILPNQMVEQRNVWLSLYNLENLFGSAETLMTLFKRSIQYQDPKTMYLSMLSILDNTEKYDKLETYFQMAIKKFKYSAKIWCRYAEYLLKVGKHDVFSQITSRVIELLPKKKQIKVISKFGQLEFKQGDPERGRTIFEGLVASYPNRTDLWNIYIDMELKIKDEAKIRNLMDRCINLKVSDKNIKQFFKKYLNFEKQHGNDKSIQRIKHLAIKFVEQTK
ncbi:HAT repeat-containing protein [Tieghemostelium lacteum]|uniref:HAT repeat-containing protein n=1 Tax=Tieghemostelium lacteum TaxID=361077 RepID=A0A151ZDY3_TIELA|nr:HAT repeat-containing protein [Tieghemostelium lacteum]|eukprot:KYQ92172.1 HAT repeat-containing protein [Tieghemostelium lacteum]